MPGAWLVVDWPDVMIGAAVGAVLNLVLFLYAHARGWFE